jgi:hypothetical protein
MILFNIFAITKMMHSENNISPVMDGWWLGRWIVIRNEFYLMIEVWKLEAM